MTLEWLDGFMLGDGHIAVNGNGARATMQSSERDWCKFALSGLSVYEPREPNEVYHPKTGKWAWQSATRTSEDLLPQRERWYPKGVRAKLIPEDLKLTPTIVRLWYLGDGSLYTGRGCYVQISTGDFSESSLRDTILPQLLTLGIEAEIHGKDRVYVAGKSTGAFFDLIGKESPIKCYDYKFAVKPYIGKKNLSQVAREMNLGRSWLAWAIKRFQIPTEKDGNRVWLTEDGETRLRNAVGLYRPR
jgi:hypothetical protein